MRDLSGEIATPKGRDGIALQLIERQFHRLAHIRAKERDRVGKGSAMFHVRQGNQVLGMQTEPPRRAARRTENAM